MKIRNQNVDPASQIGRRLLNASLVTAISQTGVVAYSFTPGHRFQITKVRTYCRVKAGTVTGVVKAGTRTVATLAFTTATELAATLSTTLANIRGSATEAITIEYTSDGTGVLTNGFVIIEFRPRPMAGDPGPT